MKRSGAVLTHLTGLLFAAPASADCVDLNAAPPDELRRIVHIDGARAAAIVDRRPWPDVRGLTEVHGIGLARLGDIEDQGLACVGRAVPAGEREVIRARAVVRDGDTFEVAGNRPWPRPRPLPTRPGTAAGMSGLV